MKVLMVLTSHDQLGGTGKTGFWLEGFAAPCHTSKDAGAEVVLAWPKGGQPPLDPKGSEAPFQTDQTRRFEADAAAKAQLAATVRLDSVSQAGFDAASYPGGHGPLWDLAKDKNSVVLRHAKTPDGKPLVEGKKVTGFTNTEEEGMGLTAVVQLLLEDELKAKGGLYSKDPDLAPHVVSDGFLITGQNPRSSGLAAKLLIDSSP